MRASVGVEKEASVVSVHYPKEKLLTQLFSIENNFSTYAF